MDCSFKRFGHSSICSDKNLNVFDIEVNFEWKTITNAYTNMFSTLLKYKIKRLYYQFCDFKNKKIGKVEQYQLDYISFLINEFITNV